MTGASGADGSPARRYAALAPSTWRNGGGSTRVVHQETSSGTEAGWRLSIASITGPAPFSRLPGVERALVVASAAGPVLRIDGAHRPTCRGDVLLFSGEDDVEVVEEVAAPVRVVNLFWSPRTHTAHVGVHRGGGELVAGATAMTVLAGSVDFRGEEFGPLDTLLTGSTAGAAASSDSLVAVFTVRARPLGDR